GQATARAGACPARCAHRAGGVRAAHGPAIASGARASAPPLSPRCGAGRRPRGRCRGSARAGSAGCGG
ncbi:MAG: hypothetical protein D6832_05880, partial [Alphaproteobacteria bacterium]